MNSFSCLGSCGEISSGDEIAGKQPRVNDTRGNAKGGGNAQPMGKTKKAKETGKGAALKAAGKAAGPKAAGNKRNNVVRRIVDANYCQSALPSEEKRFVLR